MQFAACLRNFYISFFVMDLFCFKFVFSETRKAVFCKMRKTVICELRKTVLWKMKKENCDVRMRKAVI